MTAQSSRSWKKVVVLLRGTADEVAATLEDGRTFTFDVGQTAWACAA